MIEDAPAKELDTHPLHPPAASEHGRDQQGGGHQGLWEVEESGSRRAQGATHLCYGRQRVGAARSGEPLEPVEVGGDAGISESGTGHSLCASYNQRSCVILVYSWRYGGTMKRCET